MIVDGGGTWSPEWAVSQEEEGVLEGVGQLELAGSKEGVHVREPADSH